MLPTITKDFTSHIICIEKSFSASLSTVWQAFTDDTLLVQWWWPKTWPASSQSFDFSPGGHWHYYMTGPDGVQSWGWIDYETISYEDFFTAKDAFSDADGNKLDTLPRTDWQTEFFDEWETTRVIVTLAFTSIEHMQQLIDMGFEAGFTDALDNLDTLLQTL